MLILNIKIYYQHNDTKYKEIKLGTIKGPGLILVEHQTEQHINLTYPTELSSFMELNIHVIGYKVGKLKPDVTSTDSIPISQDNMLNMNKNRITCNGPVCSNNILTKCKIGDPCPILVVSH